jgi:hypothetical protein
MFQATHQSWIEMEKPREEYGDLRNEYWGQWNFDGAMD